jgi:hypothetical protein
MATAAGNNSMSAANNVKDEVSGEKWQRFRWALSFVGSDFCDKLSSSSKSNTNDDDDDDDDDKNNNGAFKLLEGKEMNKLGEVRNRVEVARKPLGMSKWRGCPLTRVYGFRREGCSLEPLYKVEWLNQKTSSKCAVLLEYMSYIVGGGALIKGEVVDAIVIFQPQEPIKMPDQVTHISLYLPQLLSINVPLFHHASLVDFAVTATLNNNGGNTNDGKGPSLVKDKVAIYSWMRYPSHAIDWRNRGNIQVCFSGTPNPIIIAFRWDTTPNGCPTLLDMAIALVNPTNLQTLRKKKKQSMKNHSPNGDTDQQRRWPQLIRDCLPPNHQMKFQPLQPLQSPLKSPLQSPLQSPLPS